MTALGDSPDEPLDAVSPELDPLDSSAPDEPALEDSLPSLDPDAEPVELLDCDAADSSLSVSPALDSVAPDSLAPEVVDWPLLALLLLAFAADVARDVFCTVEFAPALADADSAGSCPEASWT